MKLSLSTAVRGTTSSSLALMLGFLMPATTVPLEAQTTYTQTVVTEQALLGDAELDELLGPIALYPDALIGLILPASTLPNEVTLGARYLNGGNLDYVDQQPWDDSVKGLTRFPEVLVWMDENLEWTTAVGEAFVLQPADVMNAVQRLRTDAQVAGNLVNTPQQTVVVQQEAQQEIIRIVPTDPEIIYVPVYDPQVVYTTPVYDPQVVIVENNRPDFIGNILSFGAGFAVGSWLNYDCNWGRRQIFWGDNCGWNNRPYWNDRGWYDRGRNVNVIENTNITNVNTTNVVNNNTVNQWEPSNTAERLVTDRNRNNNGNARFVSADTRKPGSSYVAANSAPDRKAVPLPRPSKIKPDDRRPIAASKPVNPGQIGNQPASDRPDNKNSNNNGKPNTAANRPGSDNKPNTPKPGNNVDRSKKPTAPPKVTDNGKPDGKLTPKPGNKPGDKPGNKPGDKPNGDGKGPDNKVGGDSKPGPSSKTPGGSSNVDASRPKAPSAPPKVGDKPSAKPSDKPSAKPSDKPVAKPSTKPGAQPSTSSNTKPVAKPSTKPTASPNLKPAAKPTAKPSTPAKPQPKPQVQQPKPQPKPQVQQPKPQVQQPKPQVQQPKPRVVQAPKPQPKPQVQQPRPQVQQPRPQVQQPRPQVQQPRPQVQQRPQQKPQQQPNRSSGSPSQSPSNSNKSKSDKDKKKNN